MSERGEKLVSVIIPSYNGALFLEEALESVLNQTHKNFEVIVVDDYSTDSSWDILTEHARKDSRIKTFRNEENRGVSATRNRGIVESSAEYIAFLDCDDTMEPTRLEKQVAYLDGHPNVAIVGSWLIHMTADGKQIFSKKYRAMWCGKDSRVLFTPLVSQTTVLMRTEVFESVGVYDEQLRGGEDYDFWLRTLSKELCIANIQEPLSSYRMHGQQETMAHSKTLRQGFRVRWKYLWSGFFSLRGLFVTLGLGILPFLPHFVRNIGRMPTLKLADKLT